MEKQLCCLENRTNKSIFILIRHQIKHIVEPRNKLAKEFKLPLKEFPADWSIGKRAGYVRNEQMAQYAYEHGNGVLFAFWDGQSKGTKLMIELAKKYHLETHIFNWEGEEYE